MLLRQSPGCAWLLTPGREFHAIYGDAQRLLGRSAGELQGTGFCNLFTLAARAAWTRRLDAVIQGQTVGCADRLSDAGPVISITLYPVTMPETADVFVGGAAHEAADPERVLRLLDAVETDRARFTRFLHDHVGQYLSAAGLQLDLVRMDLADAAQAIPARTAEIQTMLETVMAKVREFNHQLNPAVAERAGLRAALDGLAGKLRSEFRGNVRVLADAGAHPSPEPAAALFRIAQEAAENAVRHAGCTTVEILLKSVRNGICLEIRDNGHGFEAAEAGAYGRGLGMLTMQYYAQRAGVELEIRSAPESGTMVKALCRSAARSG